MCDDELLRRWEARWPECPPRADKLKSAYPDRWVRFHSLPESKRYPESPNEYTIVLDRYNTVLDELFAATIVYVITASWSENPIPHHHLQDQAWRHPNSRHWTSICVEPDPEYTCYLHLYVSEIPWKRGCLDELLCIVADDRIAGVLITDVALQRIHHPYDGGADIILTTREERDHLRSAHTEWLSSTPSGL